MPIPWSTGPTWQRQDVDRMPSAIGPCSSVAIAVVDGDGHRPDLGERIEDVASAHTTLARRLARPAAEGQMQLLTRQLVRRFGELSSAIKARLANASLEEIDRWGGRILDAATIDAIFAEE